MKDHTLLTENSICSEVAIVMQIKPLSSFCLSRHRIYSGA